MTPRPLLDTAIGGIGAELAGQLRSPERRAFWAGWSVAYLAGLGLVARSRARGLAPLLLVLAGAELGGRAAQMAYTAAADLHSIAEAARPTLTAPSPDSAETKETSS